MPLVRSGFVSACFALSSLAASANAGSTLRQDAVWKRYFNSEAKYCVSYPARWYKADAFDGSGLYVTTGVKKHSRPTGEIDVAFFPDPYKSATHASAVSLKKDFQTHVEGLTKFERAERMQVLDQRPIEISGSLGLLTKDSYYDPQDRSTWIEEILFVHHKDQIYRVELECKADQVDRFEPVFSRLLSSLQFDCPGSQ
jgi:hypothetical protein